MSLDVSIPTDAKNGQADDDNTTSSVTNDDTGAQNSATEVANNCAREGPAYGFIVVARRTLLSELEVDTAIKQKSGCYKSSNAFLFAVHYCRSLRSGVSATSNGAMGSFDTGSFTVQ